MNYTPNKCTVCGIAVFPHWKYCQEHTKGNILLDMDVNKKGVSLQKQEVKRWMTRWEQEAKDHARLKELYDTLQEDFLRLHKDGYEKFMRQQLSTPTRHDVN